MAGMVLAHGSSHCSFSAHHGKSQCVPSDFFYYSAHLPLAAYCCEGLTGRIVLLETLETIT